MKITHRYRAHKRTYIQRCISSYTINTIIYIHCKSFLTQNRLGGITMMKNNLVFFRPITKDSDPVIKLVFNGMEIPFSTEKDKSIETKNKAFLVDGLNHFSRMGLYKRIL